MKLFLLLSLGAVSCAPQKSVTSETKDVALYDVDNFVYMIDFSSIYLRNDRIVSFNISKCKPMSLVSNQRHYPRGPITISYPMCDTPEGDGQISRTSLSRLELTGRIAKIAGDVASPAYAFDKRHQELVILTRNQPELVQAYREQIDLRNEYQRNLDHYKAYESQVGSSENLTNKIVDLEDKVSEAKSEIQRFHDLHPVLAFNGIRGEPARNVRAFADKIITKLSTNGLTVYSKNKHPAGWLTEREYAVVKEVVRQLNL